MHIWHRTLIQVNCPLPAVFSLSFFYMLDLHIWHRNVVHGHWKPCTPKHFLCEVLPRQNMWCRQGFLTRSDVILTFDLETFFKMFANPLIKCTLWVNYVPDWPLHLKNPHNYLYIFSWLIHLGKRYYTRLNIKKIIVR